MSSLTAKPTRLLWYWGSRGGQAGAMVRLCDIRLASDLTWQVRKFRIPTITLANILRHFGARFWVEKWQEMGGYAKLQAFL